LCRRCSIPQGASTLTDQHTPPPPAAPAHRLRAVTWMNTRTALGTCLVLTAILAGAVFLDRAQRLVPVYAAARDLPAGAALHHGDLVVVRVRLPTTALRHYLQPTPGQTVAGRVLAAPVRHETLVPAEHWAGRRTGRSQPAARPDRSTGPLPRPVRRLTPKRRPHRPRLDRTVAVPPRVVPWSPRRWAAGAATAAGASVPRCG